MNVFVLCQKVVAIIGNVQVSQLYVCEIWKHIFCDVNDVCNIRGDWKTGIYSSIHCSMKVCSLHLYFNQSQGGISSLKVPTHVFVSLFTTIFILTLCRLNLFWHKKHSEHVSYVIKPAV